MNFKIVGNVPKWKRLQLEVASGNFPGCAKYMAMGIGENAKELLRFNLKMVLPELQRYTCTKPLALGRKNSESNDCWTKLCLNVTL